MSANDVPTCDGKVATLVVPADQPSGEWFHGTPGDDVIVGTEDWDRIDGGAGNDTICALAGADEIVGGDGDDRLFAGDDQPYSADDDYYGDRIVPGPGDDYIDLSASSVTPDDLYSVYSVFADHVSYEDAPGPVTVNLTTLTATGEGNDTFAPTQPNQFTGVSGSRFDDVLIGGPGADLLVGRGGDDTLLGLDGDDWLRGDGVTLYAWSNTGDNPYPAVEEPGNDTLDGGEGDDHLADDLGASRLLGGPGDDFIWSDRGNTIRGGDDDDLIWINHNVRRHSSRSIEGGSGTDRIWLDLRGFGKRPTAVRIDVPRRMITTGRRLVTWFRGVEKFDGEIGARRATLEFRGSRADEKVTIHAPRVRLLGRGGNDHLRGSDGDDHLDGGPGRDTLLGRYGRDRYLRGEVVRCEVTRRRPRICPWASRTSPRASSRRGCRSSRRG